MCHRHTLILAFYQPKSTNILWGWLPPPIKIYHVFELMQSFVIVYLMPLLYGHDQQLLKRKSLIMKNHNWKRCNALISKWKGNYHACRSGNQNFGGDGYVSYLLASSPIRIEEVIVLFQKGKCAPKESKLYWAIAREALLKN